MRVKSSAVSGTAAFDYDGEYWSTNALNLYTLPNERVPLYVAGNGPMSTWVAGRYADGFLTLRDIDTYEKSLVPALEDGAKRAIEIQTKSVGSVSC
ncbi:LLM class flavin-dependent oxidoreductase [Natrialba swarupiae]|nr:LLM class flavin-dependent oxidoreductase [Natrialba swarupiae]